MVGSVAGQGCLPDLQGAWPLVLLWFSPRTGTMLGMGGEECGDPSERAV